MITIKDRLRYFERKYEGANAAADFLKIDRAYWSRLKTGKKLNPSQEILDRLGLTRIVTYECKSHK